MILLDTFFFLLKDFFLIEVLVATDSDMCVILLSISETKVKTDHRKLINGILIFLIAPDRETCSSPSREDSLQIWIGMPSQVPLQQEQEALELRRDGKTGMMMLGVYAQLRGLGKR